MSSVKFQGGKSHGNSEASSFLRHCDPTPENRERVRLAKLKNGEDCFIDPEKSPRNFSVVLNAEGQAVVTSGESYENAWKKYKARVEEIDSSPVCTNHRKDRVTMRTLEIPVPDGLSGSDNYENRKKWALGLFDIVCRRYGADNVVQCAFHEDEVHDYIDAETHETRTSREHMHISFIPEKNGTFNDNKCCNRSAIIRMNNDVEAFTEAEFHVPFHTGTKKKSLAKVEELKAESRRLAAEKELEEQKNREKVEELQNIVMSLQQEIQRQKKEKEEADAELEELRKTAKDYKAKLDAVDVSADVSAIKEARTAIETDRAAISKEKERLEGTGSILDDFMKYLDTRRTNRGRTLGDIAREWYQAYQNGSRVRHEIPQPARLDDTVRQAVEHADNVKAAEDVVHVIAEDVPKAKPAEQSWGSYTHVSDETLERQNRQTQDSLSRMRERIEEARRQQEAMRSRIRGAEYGQG